MNLICMCPSPFPDPLPLLQKEGGRKNEVYVMPSKVVGLSQVLELFNIRIWVAGEAERGAEGPGKGWEPVVEQWKPVSAH
jgi:hypothetical protein